MAAESLNLDSLKPLFVNDLAYEQFRDVMEGACKYADCLPIVAGGKLLGALVSPRRALDLLLGLLGDQAMTDARLFMQLADLVVWPEVVEMHITPPEPPKS